MPERQTKNAGIFSLNLNGSQYEILEIDYFSGRIMLRDMSNYSINYVTTFTEEEMNQDRYHELVIDKWIVLINFFYTPGQIQTYNKSSYYYDRRIIEKKTEQPVTYTSSTTMTSGIQEAINYANAIYVKPPEPKEEPKIEVKPKEPEKPKVYIRENVEPSRKWI